MRLSRLVSAYIQYYLGDYTCRNSTCKLTPSNTHARNRERTYNGFTTEEERSYSLYTFTLLKLTTDISKDIQDKEHITTHQTTKDHEPPQKTTEKHALFTTNYHSPTSPHQQGKTPPNQLKQAENALKTQKPPSEN